MRKTIATWLVRMAQKIDPANQRVHQFYADLMLDFAIQSGYVIKVDMDKFTHNKEDK